MGAHPIDGGRFQAAGGAAAYDWVGWFCDGLLPAKKLEKRTVANGDRRALATEGCYHVTTVGYSLCGLAVAGCDCLSAASGANEAELLSAASTIQRTKARTRALPI